jgi:hypothetical protein
MEEKVVSAVAVFDFQVVICVQLICHRRNIPVGKTVLHFFLLCPGKWHRLHFRTLDATAGARTRGETHSSCLALAVLLLLIGLLNGSDIVKFCDGQRRNGVNKQKKHF